MVANEEEEKHSTENIPPVAALPKLLVPLGSFRGGPHITDLQFSKRDFVWFLHVAAVVLSSDSFDQSFALPGAHDRAAIAMHTLLYHSVKPYLTAPRDALSYSCRPSRLTASMSWC